MSLNKFEIESVSPNPVIQQNVKVKYSVAFDCYTNISVYNALGESVQTIFDGEMKEGIYEKEVELGDISNGVYFIKMTSGPYEETKPFIINK